MHCQCIITMQKLLMLLLLLQRSVMHQDLFRDLQGKTFLVSDQCLQHAFSLHQNMCASLLRAYQGLFCYLTSLTKNLPASQRIELGM